MLTEPFLQRALLTALCMAPLCALMGVFVTARGMAFFSDTIAHAALLGISLGLVWGFTDFTLPIVVVSLLVAGAFLWLKENTSLLTDTIMALLLSGSVSAGMVVLSRVKSFRGELHQYLFGDILSVGDTDVWLAVILLVIISFWVFSYLSPLSLITAHQELATVSGVNVRWLNFIFIVTLTLVVAVSIRLMGIILVTSLLVIPPAAARNISSTLRQQVILSILTGLLGGGGGVVLSYQLNDVPTGPTIVLCCIGLFVVSLTAAKVLKLSRANRSRTP